MNSRGYMGAPHGRLTWWRDYRNKLSADQEQLEFQLQSLPQTDRGVMVEEIFKSLGGEVYNPDAITYETYFRMIEDSAVRSALQVIINATISRGWEIDGGKPEIQKFIRDMYKNLQMETTFERVLSAFWIGFSVTEKVFEKIQQNGETRWIIEKYKVLPPETISFIMKKNGEIMRVVQNGSLLGFSDEQVVFMPKKVNVFQYDNGLQSTFGNPFGTSVLKGAYKDWFCKDWILRYKNRYLELMAGGFIVANAGELDPLSLHNQVANAKGGSLVTIREGQSIQMIFPDEEGGDTFLENLSYHDRRVREALIANIIITQEGSFGGSQGGQEVQKVFRQTRLERLQQQLEAWVQHDIKQIVDVNFGEQDDYPKFNFKLGSEEDIEKRMDFLLKGIKGQVFGRADIPWMRAYVEAPPGDPGEPLIRPPGMQNPEGSGSAGDATLRDNGTNPDPDKADAPGRDDVGPANSLMERVMHTSIGHLLPDKGVHA